MLVIIMVKNNYMFKGGKSFRRNFKKLLKSIINNIIYYVCTIKHCIFFRYRKDVAIKYKNTYYDEISKLYTRLDRKVCII